MDQEEYGSNYQAHILEQYKLYVEMTDRISQRRDQSNRFYIALLTGLLAVISVVARLSDWQASGNLLPVVLISVSVAALAVCAIWFINIRSYKQLNSGKFKIVHMMEEQLPFAPYKKEWDYLRPPTGVKKYFQLTRIEQLVPMALSIPYLFLMIYAIISLK